MGYLGQKAVMPRPPNLALCSIAECVQRQSRRGMCELHYRRMKRTGTTDKITLADRFWAKVDKRGADECWPWKGHVKPSGYGNYGYKANGEHVSVLPHRMAYTLAVGPIPPGLTLDHLCYNRSCVNPAHLEPVTLQENTRRAAMRRAKAGHPLPRLAGLLSWSEVEPLIVQSGEPRRVALARRLRREAADR